MQSSDDDFSKQESPFEYNDKKKTEEEMRKQKQKESFKEPPTLQQQIQDCKIFNQ